MLNIISLFDESKEEKKSCFNKNESIFNYVEDRFHVLKTMEEREEEKID